MPYNQTRDDPEIPQGKEAKAIARLIARVVGAGILLSATAAHAEVQLMPEGFGEAAIGLLPETTVTASDLLMTAEGYPYGISSLTFWEGSCLLLDRDLTAKRGGAVKGNCRLQAETPGRKLTMLCSDMPFSWEDTADRLCRLTIAFSPQDPLEEALDWTVLQLEGRIGSYGRCNAAPFAFECEAAGLLNAGVVFSAEEVGAGEIGLVVGGHVEQPNNCFFDSLTIVSRPKKAAVQTPEPSAAILAPEALALLVGRRRRR